jgi:hypothetical protein
VAKQAKQLEMTPEARAERTRKKREEMESKGCPFGRYPNGTPRTRPEIQGHRSGAARTYGLTIRTSSSSRALSAWRLSGPSWYRRKSLTNPCDRNT